MNRIATFVPMYDRMDMIPSETTPTMNTVVRCVGEKSAPQCTSVLDPVVTPITESAGERPWVAMNVAHRPAPSAGEMTPPMFAARPIHGLRTRVL